MFVLQGTGEEEVELDENQLVIDALSHGWHKAAILKLLKTINSMEVYLFSLCFMTLVQSKY